MPSNRNTALESRKLKVKESVEEGKKKNSKRRTRGPGFKPQYCQKTPAE
jgi:hypothetical protein